VKLHPRSFVHLSVVCTFSLHLLSFEVVVVAVDRPPHSLLHLARPVLFVFIFLLILAPRHLIIIFVPKYRHYCAYLPTDLPTNQPNPPLPTFDNHEVLPVLFFYFYLFIYLFLFPVLSLPTDESVHARSTPALHLVRTYIPESTVPSHSIHIHFVLLLLLSAYLPRLPPVNLFRSLVIPTSIDAQSPHGTALGERDLDGIF
jgi:hypothetical protein